MEVIMVFVFHKGARARGSSTRSSAAAMVAARLLALPFALGLSTALRVGGGDHDDTAVAIDEEVRDTLVYSFMGCQVTSGLRCGLFETRWRSREDPRVTFNRPRKPCISLRRESTDTVRQPDVRKFTEGLRSVYRDCT
jgi:hypothetical protein